MPGYQEDFLDGVVIPIPEFAPSVGGDLVRKDALRSGILADYPNYTVVTNAQERSPLLVAFNYDKSKRRGTDRSHRWKVDTRIGSEFQLDNDYYRSNPWDRGHLARRATAGWGENAREAQRAADETFYYSNACLQHENFNQDEWLELEDWVMDLELTRDGKITVLMGPIYGFFARTIRPSGRQPAAIPSGFFKIVCFINGQTQKLDVRAFIMFQDQEALADKRGRNSFDFQKYQVTVTEIEELTGLQFDDQVYAQNPLLYHENPEGRDQYNISHFPERIEVDTPQEMIAADSTRDYYADELVQVYITAAMVNAKGREREGEWIAIANYSNNEVDLDGWTLSDTKREPLDLGSVLAEDQRVLGPGESIRVKPVAPLQLANHGGVIALYAKPELGDSGPRRISRIKYGKQGASRAGIPVVFGY